MPRSESFPANPEVLAWARQQAGLTSEVASAKLGFEVGVLENEQRVPTIRELKRIAALYSLPLATLLLSSPPQGQQLPDDYRTIGGVVQTLSTKTARIVREVQNSVNAYADLVEEFGNVLPGAPLPIATLDHDPSQLAAGIREILGVRQQDQLDWPDAREAFAYWRWRLEAIGVLVFLVGLPSKELRGFSILASESVMAVAVNSEEAEAGQSFTLFHEIAHLLLLQAALCSQKENVSRGQIERFCNEFSANVLMPASLIDSVLSQEGLSNLHQRDWRLAEVIRVAARLKTSSQATALRLGEMGIVPHEFYESNFSQWDADNWPTAPRFGRTKSGTYQRRYLNRYGSRYVSAIIEALKRGDITEVDADELLGAKAKHLGPLETDLLVGKAKYAPNFT